MPFALQIVISFLWSLVTSRFGQIGIAFVVAWFWSGFKADNHWKSVIAAQEAARDAAYQKEIIRQEEAAREIAEEATKRAEEDQKAKDEMRRIIEAFDKRDPIYVEKKITAPGNCRIDDDFSSVVRQLDAQARKGKAPKRSR